MPYDTAHVSVLNIHRCSAMSPDLLFITVLGNTYYESIRAVDI
jgi:hypothetical protein